MPTTRAQQAERTRRAVLETAQRLFTEQGYDATSLQSIADTMGVRKANVYYYFRTKIEILEALLESSVTEFRAMLDTAETMRDRQERLEFLVDGFVGQVIARRSIAPMGTDDPSMRRDSGIRQTLDGLAERGLRVIFGEQPTAEQRAAYWMVNDLAPVTRRSASLSDEELRGILRRLCLRVLDV